MAATIGQKHKNGFKIVEIWDNHSESLKNNLYNDFKGPEHLLGGMNLENEIDTCQTTVHVVAAKPLHIDCHHWYLKSLYLVSYRQT